MKVFITGATGFIGKAIVQQLLNCGHQVLGLARSDSSAEKLIAAGAKVHQGDLNDLDSLRRGAELSDGIIHAGFIHDIARYTEVCETDRNVIETFGNVIVGTDRPLVIASGTMMIHPGNLATEEMNVQVDPAIHPRAITELTADALAKKGIHTSLIRLAPLVHGEADLQGFTRVLIAIAREKGIAAYVNDGQNRWPAVHYQDAAKLFRLALDKNIAGSRIHAVENDGITFKIIAEAIGKKLNIPIVSISTEEATNHFGWLSYFAALDAPASNKITREIFEWHPEHPSWLEDMKQDFYFN
jgi:nucleoside-diphosphate-sugar epimerase